MQMYDNTSDLERSLSVGSTTAKIASQLAMALMYTIFLWHHMRIFPISPTASTPDKPVCHQMQEYSGVEARKTPLLPEGTKKKPMSPLIQPIEEGR
tara:strand:+ start:569 stop:856 length:288 start_codon:yes stop_codon:yes gene_type:complete